MRRAWIAQRLRWLSLLPAGAVAAGAVAPAWAHWFSPLAFAALGGVLSALARPRARALAVLLFALSFFAAGAAWIHDGILGDAGGASPRSVALFAAFLALCAALPAALFALCERLLAPAGGAPSAGRAAVALAVSWSGAEWLRSQGPWAFPWLAVGSVQLDNALVAGWLPLAGVHGASFVAVGVSAWAGALVASYGAQPPAPVRPRAAAALLAVVMAGAAVGARVEWTQPAGAPVAIALLQSNEPRQQKWDDAARVRALAQLAELAATSPARVVVTPETYLLDAVQSAHGGFWAHLQRRARERDIHLLVGGVYAEGSAAARPRLFNAIVHVAPARVDVYAKRRLAPFGEYLPWPQTLGMLWGDLFRYPLQDLAPADPAFPATLYVAGQEVAASICFELAFAAETARLARSAGWLLNVSNDAWFESALYRRQALQIARTRALETQRWVARANNVGHTALIAPDGRVTALPEGEAAVLQGSLQPRTGLTPYQRVGDAGVLTAAALALGSAWLTGARVRRVASRDLREAA
ncbi:MAG: apolipoprotein N-acyltransferase [Burkholderiaceae bacterium]|nr:apolipoprotein N-acyltransferase [Burkholderiaceae bacterium]